MKYKFINSKAKVTFFNTTDSNSDNHSTQEKVRESNDLQFNPSNQKGNNKDQVIGDNKDNTNINNADGKSENSVARN